MRPDKSYRPQSKHVPAKLQKISRSAKSSRPAPRRPGPLYAGARAYLPYPVFERDRVPEPVRRDESAADTTPGDMREDGTDGLAWQAPVPLASVPPSVGSGLFVVERMANRRWSPVFVGMSAVGVGHAMAWIAEAPGILGLDVDLSALRVRVAEAEFSTSTPAGRAQLRRLRDTTAAARTTVDGQPVPVGPGPVAPPVP